MVRVIFQNTKWVLSLLCLLGLVALIAHRIKTWTLNIVYLFNSHLKFPSFSVCLCSGHTLLFLASWMSLSYNTGPLLMMILYLILLLFSPHIVTSKISPQERLPHTRWSRSSPPTKYSFFIVITIFISYVCDSVIDIRFPLLVGAPGGHGFVWFLFIIGFVSSAWHIICSE